MRENENDGGDGAERWDESGGEYISLVTEAGDDEQKSFTLHSKQASTHWVVHFWNLSSYRREYCIMVQ